MWPPCAGGSRLGSGRLVVKLGRRAVPERESPPPAVEEEPGAVFDPQGAASAALLRDLHTALLAAAQGVVAMQGSGEAPAVAPEKAVLYSVESPPGPIVWPEDVGVHLLNAPVGEGSVPYAAHVRTHCAHVQESCPSTPCVLVILLAMCSHQSSSH